MDFSYERANKNLNNQLYECSILLVSLLLDQYKSKAINLTDFRNHTTKKISYIVNNWDSLEGSIDKTTVEKLLNECNEINKDYLF